MRAQRREHAVRSGGRSPRGSERAVCRRKLGSKVEQGSGGNISRFPTSPHRSLALFPTSQPRGPGGGSKAAPEESKYEGKHLGQKQLLAQPVGSRDSVVFPCSPWTPLHQGRKEKDPKRLQLLKETDLLKNNPQGGSQVAHIV